MQNYLVARSANRTNSGDDKGGWLFQSQPGLHSEFELNETLKIKNKNMPRGKYSSEVDSLLVQGPRFQFLALQTRNKP